MPRDFILKAGSHGESLYFILDGEAVMFGIDNDIIAILRCGSFFNNDISLSDNHKDNYYGKRICHIVT